MCVYKIIFSEWDPLDIIPDISLQAMDLNGVESELFS